MLAAIASFFAAHGLSEPRARQISIGVVILCVVLGLWLAKLFYDRAVIDRHDANQAVEVERADRAADAAAATQRRTDDARLEAEADALEKVTENVSINDPRAARRAYYECVRLQQEARKLGRLTPTC